MSSGDGAAASRGAEGRRGVSFAAFLVTLGVLLLLLVLALQFVNRWTRIPAPAPAGPAVRTALDLALRALSKDAGAAASGRLSPREAFLPVLDNAPAGARFEGRAELSTEVRPGTDALGLRGILRSPSVALGASPGAAGRLVPAPDGADEIRSQPSRARLRLRLARAPEAPGSAGAPDAEEAAALLRSRLAARGRKTFFVLGDAVNRYAVSAVAGSVDRTAKAPLGCAPPPDGCHLELTLDFTDTDAVRLAPGGAADAALGLGPVTWGGLFDDVVYFVARGPLGRPPDYFVVSDPASLTYPRPYLAAAENIGGGRWEVTRVADDVENLHVAWQVGSPGEAEWRADRPGAPLYAPDRPGQGARLLAVRIAAVAKGTERLAVRSSAELSGDILPFDAPRPRGDAAPIGWSGKPYASVGFERETRYLAVPFAKAP
jgi:hypothetical protein